ncbi:MAG TPA: hypothetical protein VE131_02545 [Terriglobales bacterium]|nr:hypothetical protein [Terriglobales bacterium]
MTRDLRSLSSFDFPGAMVSKEDCSSELLKRCRGLSSVAVRKTVGAGFTPREASSPWLAAIRTLFLDLGILLAVDDAGRIATSDPDLRIRLLARRPYLREGSLSFESFLTQDGLWGDASSLLHFSSWRTALPSGREVNSHYYVVSPSATEKLFPVFPTVGRWLSPDEGVLACDRGDLQLSFSTFALLRKLADFDSPASLFKEYGKAHPAASASGREAQDSW